jgi:hypothetical protein
MRGEGIVPVFFMCVYYSHTFKLYFEVICEARFLKPITDQLLGRSRVEQEVTAFAYSTVGTALLLFYS